MAPLGRGLEWFPEILAFGDPIALRFPFRKVSSIIHCFFPRVHRPCVSPPLFRALDVDPSSLYVFFCLNIVSEHYNCLPF